MKYSTTKFVIFIVANILLFAACSSKGPKKVLKKANMATFIISNINQNGQVITGSGFFIDKDGTGITNYHVLDNCEKAIIKLQDGTCYEINQVLVSDKNWDIIKFSINHDNGKQFNFLRFSDKRPEQGDKIYLLGAPHGMEQTFTEGIVSAIRTDSHGQIIQITAPALGGNSGSPIMNEDGDVVAVLTYGIDDVLETYNYGVLIDDYKLSSLTSNDFYRNNIQFLKLPIEVEESEIYIDKYMGTGIIGKYPITMSLEIEDRYDIKGWYFYDKKESETEDSGYLNLIGFLKNDDFILYEIDENNDTTGFFEGKFNENKIFGNFTTTSSGKSFPFKIKLQQKID